MANLNANRHCEKMSVANFRGNPKNQKKWIASLWLSPLPRNDGKAGLLRATSRPRNDDSTRPFRHCEALKTPKQSINLAMTAWRFAQKTKKN